MANQRRRNMQNSKKDSKSGIDQTYQVESGLKKAAAPQHVFEGKQSLWWQSSLQHEECPITLESFATLPYPPFSLSGEESGPEAKISTSATSSKNKFYYFDGFALASYLVARGIFENPLTRQALTMDDCRRLDAYLDIFQKKHSSLPMEQDSRAVSVAEAFSLQQSIQVEKTSSNQRDQEEARAQVLRRTATAALAGLFDYSRPTQHRRQAQRQQRERGNQISEGATKRNQDPRLTEWGLDLSRTVGESSGQNDTGWTIIDDDEELVTAAQRDAYEFVQKQFPRLSDRNVEGRAAHNYDESIIHTARSVALQEEKQNQRHAEAIAQAQERLRTMALRQQEERKKQQKEEWEQGHIQWEQEQREKEELMRARQEIDAWRAEQWETLRQISEEQITRSKEAGDHTKKDLEPENEALGACPPDASNSLPNHETTIEEAKSSKKAKAAAKRKRAKARKQAQKAAAKAALEEKQKQEELVAKKAASAQLCAACGGGMLDAGFEKFGLKFCSTKCARAAKPPDR